MKRQLLITLIGTLILLFSLDAEAATISMTANISFDTPLTVTLKNDISFGAVVAGVAGTYTISPSGTVTSSGSGQSLYGAKAAGNITIVGSTTQTLNISVSNYTANGGVTPANATCSYASGASGPCTITAAAAPGAGKTLLIGVDAIVDGTQAVGAVASPSFTVTIVYG